jgi:hypothetical protein
MITDGQDQDRNTGGTFSSQSAQVLFYNSCPIVSVLWDIRNTGTYTLSFDGVDLATVTVSSAPSADVEFTLSTPFVPAVDGNTLVVVKLTRTDGAAGWSDKNAGSYTGGCWWKSTGLTYNTTYYAQYSIPVKFKFDESVRPVVVGHNSTRVGGADYTTVTNQVTFKVAALVTEVRLDIQTNGTYTLSWNGTVVASAVVSGAPTQALFTLATPKSVSANETVEFIVTQGSSVAYRTGPQITLDYYFLYDIYSLWDTYSYTYILPLRFTLDSPISKLILNPDLLGGFTQCLRGGF